MTTKTLQVVARVRALPDQIEALKTVLISLLEPTRSEKGCIYYNLLQNQEDPCDFTFVEEWESLEDLENHLASQHIQEAINKINSLVVNHPDIRRYDLIS